MREHHDRLDKLLHTLAYTGKECGSIEYLLEDAPGGGKQLKVGEDGQPIGEPRYCGHDCPTLIAKIKGAP